MSAPTRALTRSAVLLAAALALSRLESLLPPIAPLPGVKLGLANIASLIALYLLGGGAALRILLLRCLLGAIFGGSAASLLLSLSGGLLAMLMMLLARALPGLSIYGVSVLGAAAHGAGQLLAAMLLMDSTAIAAYLPLLLLASLPTGLATGALGAGTLRALSPPRHPAYR